MACSTDTPRSTTAGSVAGRAIPVPRPPLTGALNARDRELVQLLADGRSTAQIAVAMAVSSNTARTRIRRVGTKLEVAGRRQIVDAAHAHGIV
jgi:DNA-binding CsgD family transcriptional regulator